MGRDRGRGRGRDRDRKSLRRDGRGQSAVDFLVGASLFMATVGFLFLFVPEFLGPFTHNQELPLVADRVANDLVEYRLADGTSTSSLGTACTVAFFTADESCSGPAFEAGDELSERLGVDDRYRMHIALEAPTDTATTRYCVDTGSRISCDTDSGTALAVGPDPPTGSDGVVVARRGVWVDGQFAYLVVTVW